MLPQASSHQIHAARFSSQQEVSSSGVQKCGRTLANKNVECTNVFFTFYISCSARLTIVANVVSATGTALLGTPRSSVINLIYYIKRKIFSV